MAQENKAEEWLPLEAQIVERTREIERRRQVAEGLRGILAVLNSNRLLEEILDYIVSEARRLLGADAAAIYRMLSEQVLSIQSASGLSAEYIAQADISLGQLATGRAVLNRQPVAISNIDETIAENAPYTGGMPILLLQQLRKQFQSILSVPLIIKEEPVGALTLYYAEPRAFDLEEIELAVAFCDQSALAIENARLRDHLREEAISDERARLARDLHDSVTQMLFSASLIAEVLPAVWKRDQQEGEQALDELRQLTRGSLAEMRSMLLELRPSALEHSRLEDLLRQLAEAASGRMRVQVKVTVHGQSDLPEMVRLAFYRIAQEALNNISRHSGATQVDIVFTAKPESGAGVELYIHDNGGGFNLRDVHADHLGLNIMRERAHSVCAEITISSQPGEGTDIRVAWTPPERMQP